MMRKTERKLEKKRKNEGGSKWEKKEKNEDKKICPFDAKKVCPVTLMFLYNPF
jgi:hypothetical protein